MDQTASGLYVPRGTVEVKEMGAEAALDKHYQAMAKLEYHFPALVRLALKLASSLAQMVEAKGMTTQAVLMESPRWRSNGMISVKLGLDPEAPRITTTEKPVANFSTLKQVNETLPQVVDLAMALAFQLVPAVNAKRIMPRDVLFSNPVFSAADDSVNFRVTVKGRGLALPSNVSI